MQALLGRAAALGLSLGLLAAGPAQGTGYPDRAVTIVVPAAPGGGGDFTARLLADGLTAALSQSVIVENRAGASGNIAAQYVARSQPDGYTLLLAYSGTHVVNPVLFDKLQWDPIKSFAPVALTITAPQVIVVNNDLPVTTLKALVDYARQHPGEINYASSGVGTMQHIGAELLGLRTGTQMTHVPYKGAGAAMTDLLSGQIGLLVTTPPAVVGYLRSGSLRALAIASKRRHPMLPDVPTTAEAGVPDVELDAWFALYAPIGTPQAAIDRLAAAVKTVVESDNFKQRAEQAGTYATFMGPDELGDFTRSELKYWSDAIGQTGIKVE
ncbi:Bug family tripartite tricarboxylate transporter substrate binding protein [Bordetella tumulicola]|uniref:Bug family tripartite tricarboxylate transporter substrate binding protein n=1 Tax=Bordetella tumulicola TaxID=1649133 RepID=UPI0039F14BD1